MIEVRLFATFRDGREKVIFLEANNFTSVKDIVHHLNLPEKELAIILINGFHSKVDDFIKDNDVLALFPPIGGG